MKIDIIIDNETRSFVAPFISARKLKRTLVIGSEISSNPNNPENFDTMAEFIADIYGNKFTIDQVLDGISASDLITTFTNCVEAVTGNLNVKSKELADTSPNE